MAPSTIPHLWTRHIADSLQLLRWAPQPAHWIDLGSGAGFPGLVLACALKERPGTRVTLVEATRKKARFLEDVIRATRAPAEVLCDRIENCAERLAQPGILLTARALAPLPQLLRLAAPLFAADAQALFLKGREVQAELTAARESWMLDLDIHPSITDPGGRILSIARARPFAPGPVR